jgi:hypothetical protein
MLFILPPQHVPIKDIQDDALNECLGIVYISINFICSVVARTIFETMCTIRPTLFPGSTFDIAYNDNTKGNSAKEEKEGVGNGD